MEENKTSVLSNGLIWFGAGVSMSEILTGTYFAPLGMKTGLLAILIGHVIGCILLFLAGYLGAKTNNNAMTELWQRMVFFLQEQVCGVPSSVCYCLCGFWSV